jgi:hypothetical protein
VRHAGVQVQFDRHARPAERERVADGLVAEDVQLPHLDVRGRQAGRVFEPSRRGLRVDLAVLVSWSQQGVPARGIVVIGPPGERRDVRVGRRRAVVEHRVDEQLARHCRAFPVAAQDGEACGEAAAGAVAHDRDSFLGPPVLRAGRAD